MFPHFNSSFTSAGINLKMLGSAYTLLKETKDKLPIPRILRAFAGSPRRILSPVPHLLHSNAPPSDAEVILISGAITIAQGGIMVLGEELHLSSESMADISRFEKRRSALVNFKAAHKALLSPLRRMPPEILELIFKETTGELSYQYPADSQSSGIQLPVVFQVSRLWRDIALSTPNLWNNIIIDLSLKSSTSKAFMHLIHLRLLRSNKSYLKIILFALLPSHTNHPALTALLNCSDRWEAANIHTSPAVISSFQRIEGKLSVLRRLELTIYRYGRLQQPMFSIFEDAPRLREVFLRGGWLSMNFKFPWRQLVHYEDDQGHKGGSYSILNSLTTVKDLKLTWRSSEPLIDDLTFNNLETLHIHFVSHSHRGFFEHLTLPNAKEIKVLKHRSDPTPRLIRMIERSPSPSLLHTLTLRSDFRKPGSLSTLLLLTPALQDLDIHMPSTRDLAYLTIKPFRIPLVPNLRNFHLVAGTVKGLEDTLRHLASSRCESYSLFVTNKSFAKGKYRTMPRVCKLDSFSISLSDENILEERELIERRVKGIDSEASEELEELKAWKTALVQLSNANANATKALSIRGTSSSWKLERLDGVFSSMAKHRFKDVRLLHLSSLHIELHRFASRTPGTIPGDKRYQFRKRARDLLDSWAGLFLLDVRNRHWALKGQISLVYIPRDDGLRKCDPLSIIYGLNEEEREGVKC